MFRGGKLTVIILILIFIIAAAVSAGFYYLRNDRLLPDKTAGDMPDFSGVSVSGDTITSQELLKDKNLLLFISTRCPHCRKEVAEIRENLGTFRDYDIWLVSVNEEIHHSFADEFDLRDIENLELLKAPKETFRNFEIVAVPQLLIYKRGQLVQRLKGYRPVEELSGYL